MTGIAFICAAPREILKEFYRNFMEWIKKYKRLRKLHHTDIFKLWREFSTNACGFSILHMRQFCVLTLWKVTLISPQEFKSQSTSSFIDTKTQFSKFWCVLKAVGFRSCTFWSQFLHLLNFTRVSLENGLKRSSLISIKKFQLVL